MVLQVQHFFFSVCCEVAVEYYINFPNADVDKSA